MTLPASLETILKYLGHLFDTGRAQATSLQPYLSAINWRQKDLGFEGPAKGPIVQAARRGYSRLKQQFSQGLPPAPAPLSAAFIGKVLDIGLHTKFVSVPDSVDF